MTFPVRLFYYRGNTQMRDNLPKQFSSDSIRMLEEPYEASETLTSNGATPVTSAPDTTHNRVTMVRVEIPDGAGIRYEVQPPSGGRVPGTNSPRLQGVDHFPFFPGFTFSFVDLANFP